MAAIINGYPTRPAAPKSIVTRRNVVRAPIGPASRRPEAAPAVGTQVDGHGTL
jgi:hypothetical protein